MEGGGDGSFKVASDSFAAAVTRLTGESTTMVDGERATEGEGAFGFLRDFLSRFKDECRHDTSSAVGSGQGAEASRESRMMLVRTAGDVLLHCAAHLSQVSLLSRSVAYLHIVRSISSSPILTF